MKLTFITNACCIYEHEGFRLLADPWLVPGAFGTWTHHPPIKTRPEDVKGVDALYISHIHPDHLCEKTLEVFRRDIPIVTLRDKLSLADKKLRELGFTNIHALFDKHLTNLGPFTVTVFGPFAKHPFHECEIGNVVDSAILISTYNKRILNTNDNTFTPEAARRFAEQYGQVDIAQLNSNAAGPYPLCFDNLSHEEKLSERDRILRRQLDNLIDVTIALKPKMVMPFAGQYKLGFGYEHLNQYLPVQSDRATADELRGAGAVPLVLAEGESYEL